MESSGRQFRRVGGLCCFILLLACLSAHRAHALIALRPVAYDTVDVADLRTRTRLPGLPDELRLTFDTARPATLSEKEYSALSGVGGITCDIAGRRRTVTAFLVGSFDVAVTVAHAFDLVGSWMEPQRCFYMAAGPQGIIIERIPLASIYAQWRLDPATYGTPANDLAVVRLTRPSRLATHTLAFTRFVGSRAPVRLVGFRSQISMTALHRSPTGNAYAFRAAPCGRFAHDIDSRSIAAGAPLIDARNGVVLGLHVQLTPHSAIANACRERGNVMIPMNEWLEHTLRAELERPRGQLIVSSGVPTLDAP